MGDFAGLRTWVEDIAAEVVEVAREREFEVEPEDVTALPPSHDETNGWGAASKDEQRKCFFEMESTGKDAAKMVELTTKVLELLHKLIW